MPDRKVMLALLQDLEAELRALSLWESVVPPAEAFESSLPFFFDTMVFNQWLQWVFIARFRAIIEGGHSLPASCMVASMAEEAFRELDVNGAEIVALLRRFDALFDEGSA